MLVSGLTLPWMVERWEGLASDAQGRPSVSVRCLIVSGRLLVGRFADVFTPVG